MTKEERKLYEQYNKELKQIQKTLKENSEKMMEEMKNGKRKRIYNR